MNHRIRCRDKIRARRAREKKQILRELLRCGEIAFSVVGDISKAQRRYKHQESEHGFMGCQIDTEETVPGDPDSQIVCVNKVGHLRALTGELLVDADFAACGIRATRHRFGSRLPHRPSTVRRRP